MKLLLERFADHISLGCPGILTLDGEYLGTTMEQIYADNKPYISCVPRGTYKLVPHHSKKYGDVFMMVNPELNVYAFKDDRIDDTDRFKCYFTHRGSYHKDFKGCVGVGRLYTLIGYQMGVNDTRDTSKAVNKRVLDEGITELEIRWKHEHNQNP